MWSAEVQRHDKIYNDPLEVMMFKKWLGVRRVRAEEKPGQDRAGHAQPRARVLAMVSPHTRKVAARQSRLYCKVR